MRHDVFGRHWPMAGEPRNVPPHLLRVGLRFSDGRRATTVAGWDRPLGGPMIWPLGGGGHGTAGQPGGRFQQGYWVAPLPPSGPCTLFVEWPAAGIALVSREFDGDRIGAAAEQARGMFHLERVVRDECQWQLGSAAELAWINGHVNAGRTITSSIPPVFAAYCTLLIPDSRETTDAPDPRVEHERALLYTLEHHTGSGERQWWLGYLGTGASDVVFPYAPRVKNRYGHGFVLVHAGRPQAADWRSRDWKLAVLELMFPIDHAWLAATDWDATWTCVGGSEALIAEILGNPVLGPRARRVSVEEDAIPPGHDAY